MRKFDPSVPAIEPDHRPELHTGEVFVTNVRKDESLSAARFDWDRWKTGRKGSVAYDADDNELPDCVPVFAQRSELEAAGIDADDPYGFRRIQRKHAMRAKR